MLRLLAAAAFAVLLPTTAQAQMRSCSNIYIPECSKSPFAPSGQAFGYWAAPYGYGDVPYGYYGGSYGYYRRAPYGYYRRAPYGY
jgi:hypothetical protein